MMRKKCLYQAAAVSLMLMTSAAFSGCNEKESKPAGTTAPSTIEAISTDASQPTSEPFSTDDTLSGGWTMYTGAELQEIPEKAKAAFDKAMEQLMGADYTIAAYLGSQIVSGTNYAFLCNCTPVTANPATTLKLVTINEDLEGTATVSDISDIDVTAYTQEKDLDFQQVTGGFQAEEAVGVSLPEYAQAAFDKAMEGLTGVGYEPIALLASQIVAGSNYAILCKATSVTAEPVTKLAVVTIYSDLNSGAEITSICPFSH